MLLIHCQHNLQVSTHSRAEAAARIFVIEPLLLLVSTHSRAEAAAGTISRIGLIMPVSTHSRAEAAAWVQSELGEVRQSFNTQPRGGGCNC